MQTFRMRVGNIPIAPAFWISVSQYVSRHKFIKSPMIRTGIIVSFRLIFLFDIGISFLCKKNPQQLPVRNADSVNPGKGGKGDSKDAPRKSDAA